jgi:threonine dehydratase
MVKVLPISAYIASKMGYPCVIVVPEGAMEAKVQAIKSFGAEVIYCGTYSEERLSKARELSEERKMIFIYGFDDPKVIVGQGTIGLEILKDFPEVEVILV